MDSDARALAVHSFIIHMTHVVSEFPNKLLQEQIANFVEIQESCPFWIFRFCHRQEAKAFASHVVKCALTRFDGHFIRAEFAEKDNQRLVRDDGHKPRRCSAKAITPLFSSMHYKRASSFKD